MKPIPPNPPQTIILEGGYFMGRTWADEVLTQTVKKEDYLVYTFDLDKVLRESLPKQAATPEAVN